MRFTVSVNENETDVRVNGVAFDAYKNMLAEGEDRALLDKANEAVRALTDKIQSVERTFKERTILKRTGLNHDAYESFIALTGAVNKLIVNENATGLVEDEDCLRFYNAVTACLMDMLFEVDEEPGIYGSITNVEIDEALDLLKYAVSLGYAGRGYVDLGTVYETVSIIKKCIQDDVSPLSFTTVFFIRSKISNGVSSCAYRTMATLLNNSMDSILKNCNFILKKLSQYRTDLY